MKRVLIAAAALCLTVPAHADQVKVSKHDMCKRFLLLPQAPPKMQDAYYVMLSADFLMTAHRPIQKGDAAMLVAYCYQHPDDTIHEAVRVVAIASLADQEDD